MKSYMWVLFVSTIFLSTSLCQAEDLNSEETDEILQHQDEGRPAGQPISFKSPDINEEEQHSSRIPSNLLCDGCMVVAYQLGERIKGYHDLKYKKPGKFASESDIIDEVEKICKSATFENYGLKAVDGVNRISGPGMDAEGAPGMMQGGGRWPRRLETICGEIIGVVDEYEIYKFILENGKEKLQDYLCSNDAEEELNACAKEVPKSSKDEL